MRRSLQICLSNNDFEFDGRLYLQVHSTAMGGDSCRLMQTYTISEWETEAMAKCPLQPIFYFRFLDDIIGAWSHGEEKFREFVEILNSHHSSIKLKFEIGRSEVNFLDTTVMLNNESGHKVLQTKVYFKPTDTHALLHKSSYGGRQLEIKKKGSMYCVRYLILINILCKPEAELGTQTEKSNKY